MVAVAVDASAIAAVLFMEPDAEAVLSELDGDLIAPLLLPFEVANVCRNKMRRDPARAGAWLARYRRLPDLDITLVSVDMDVLPTVAERFGLSAYDAAYLQAALQHSARLVTLDGRLRKGYEEALRGTRPG